MGSSHLFSLTNQVFWGLAISVAYGAASAGIIFWLQPGALEHYVETFVVSFNCIISGGLIIGTAFFVYSSQKSVPRFIEESFDAAALSKTKFAKQKLRYLSRGRSMRFATYFTLASFFIFFACKFPLDGAAQYFMIAFGCIQYSLGIYVGRKLYYIAKMLHSVTNIEIGSDIFRRDVLSSVISYVNVLSTLTVVFVYVHVKSYYNGPFQYPYGFGHTLQFLLLLPAIVATPVIVVFNFYPRSVLRVCPETSCGIAEFSQHEAD
jgi:hypothetical protein